MSEHQDVARDLFANIRVIDAQIARLQDQAAEFRRLVSDFKSTTTTELVPNEPPPEI